MLRRSLLGFAVALAGFVAGVLLLAPADKVVGLASLPPNVRFGNIDGRVLNGHVSYVQSGRTTINNLSWKLQPLALLGATLAAHVNLRVADAIPANGDVSAGLSKAVTLTDWAARFRVADLKPVMQIPYLPVDGRALVDLQRARISPEGKPELLRGQIRLEAVQWTLLKPAAELGHFVIDVDTNDEGIIVATVSDEQAKIGVSGTVQLMPDGQYIADLALEPRPDTPPMIRNTLPALGRPNPDGSYPVKQRGRIPGL